MTAKLDDLLPPSGDVTVRFGDRALTLTHLDKPFWPDDGISKRDLLTYYLRVAPHLLPHLKDRPMVLRRYPNGVRDDGFFMKQAPAHRPAWVETVAIRQRSRRADFVLVQDLPTLLWVVNLGCIDLNPWYARADDLERPDLLYFDLDPGDATPFAKVREGALVLHDALAALGMPAYVKTTGSRGMHVAVPILRGPAQRDVWAFSKALAHELGGRHPQLFTVDYALARRPRDRVLIDHKQNARGQTLASIYSVRPRPRAPVSTPLTWREVAREVAIEDYRLDNVLRRLARRGDLWADLLAPRGRVDLGRFL
jgi:bifunctional non-homologous end joining protein LigD